MHKYNIFERNTTNLNVRAQRHKLMVRLSTVWLGTLEMEIGKGSFMDLTTFNDSNLTTLVRFFPPVTLEDDCSLPS